MNTTLDGQSLFDQQQIEIEIGSISRDSMERTITGLDGVLSIDMGRRSRKIKQKGTLIAKSQLQMDKRISAISNYMDGDTHKLVTDSGQEFDDLRMDVFKVSKERTSGGGMVVDYEIVYTQLKV